MFYDALITQKIVIFQKNTMCAENLRTMPISLHQKSRTKGLKAHGSEIYKGGDAKGEILRTR